MRPTRAFKSVVVPDRSSMLPASEGLAQDHNCVQVLGQLRRWWHVSAGQDGFEAGLVHNHNHVKVLKQLRWWPVSARFTPAGWT
eukprot:273244-Pelagomonas_calceolata.AAC.4